MACIGLSGDVMSHVGFSLAEAEGQAFADHFAPGVWQFAARQSELWGNLEGPVTAHRNGLEFHRRLCSLPSPWPRLFVPLHYLEVLQRLNFTVLGVANNHAFDFLRADTPQQTAAYLSTVGIAAPGCSFSPVLRSVEGISFAVFAVTCLLNPPFPPVGVALLTRATAPAFFRVLACWARRVDYVAVLVHWGDEYTLAPTPTVLALCKQLLAAGAAIVAGSHPHVLWPAYQPTPRSVVCLSLGNFSQIVGCGREHPQAPHYDRALAGVLVSLEATSARLTLKWLPTRTRHNYDAWLAGLGLHTGYWRWTPREFARWAAAGNRRPRLRAVLEVAGKESAGPLEPATIRRLQAAACRAGDTLPEQKAGNRHHPPRIRRGA